MPDANIDKWIMELEFARGNLAEAVNKTRTTDGIITATLAVGIGLLQLMKSQIDPSAITILLFGATIISLLFDYLIVLSWAYIYDMAQYAARVMALEKIVNTKLGENIFIWESSVCIKLNTTSIVKSTKLTGVINPNVLRGFVSVILYVFFQAWIFILMNSINTGNNGSNIWSIVVGIFNVIFLSFVFIQWYRTMGVDFRKRTEKVVNDGFIGDNSSYQEGLVGNRFLNWIKTNPKIIILIATLCLGFIPILVSCLIEGNFWFNGKIDLPYVTNTSVWFGDLVLLPLFNVYFINFIIDGIKNKRFLIKRLTLLFSVIFILSVILSIIIHYFFWAADNATGFFDMFPHQLTISGIFHLIYTAIQLPIIIVYFLFRKKMLSTEESKKSAKILGRIILIFSLLSIPNFIISNFMIAHRSFTEAISLDWLNLMTIPLVISALLITMFPKKK